MENAVRNQALAAYIAMGADRSLDKLHRVLTEENGGKPPIALRTLKGWSTDDKWHKAAERQDRAIAERLQSRAQTLAVREGFDRIKSLQIAAQVCLDSALSANIVPNNAAEVRALIGAAIDAIKMSEVLTGGVSDRTERAHGMASRAQELLRQLEHDKRTPMIDITPDPGTVATQAPAPAQEEVKKSVA